MFVLLIFIFMQPVKADYLDYAFFAEPEITVMRDDRQNIPVQSICAEMRYNYLEEARRLEDLKAKLAWALQQPLTDAQAALIESLKIELRKTTGRLVFLSRYEWNSEILSYLVKWRLPPEYDSTEKNVINSEVKAVYYKGDFAGPFAPRLQFHGLFPALTQLPSVPPFKPVKNISRFFQFYARGTYLDVCQFVPTIEFEVELEFFLLGLPTQRSLQQMLFLKGRSP